MSTAAWRCSMPVAAISALIWDVARRPMACFAAHITIGRTTARDNACRFPESIARREGFACGPIRPSSGMGMCFSSTDRKAIFPLPFFDNCDPAEFVASPTFRFTTDSPWFMLVGNGFDTQHFHAVHDRKLLGTTRVDCLAPFARRMQFEAEVIGPTLFDRLLRRFVGAKVQIKITSWGGPLVLVEGIFRRAHSRLLVASQPVDDDNTLSDVIVFARRASALRGGRLADWANLRVRRRFTQAFAQGDIDRLRGIRYQPEGLTTLDQDLIDFFRWAATLPRSEYEEPTP